MNGANFRCFCIILFVIADVADNDTHNCDVIPPLVSLMFISFVDPIYVNIFDFSTVHCLVVLPVSAVASIVLLFSG